MSRRKHPPPAYAPKALGHDERMRRRMQALTAYVQADHAHRAASARYGATLLRLAPLSSYDREVLLAQRNRERAASAMAFHRAATRLHRQEHPIAREDEARAVRARLARSRQP